MIGRTLLHYTILSELGAGGMGRVYLARDTLTERHVAIKVLASESGGAEACARLIREARAAARLSHPNIVTLLAAEEHENELFLVEELVEGETLAQRLTRGPLDAGEAVRLARELTAALVHAHGHGVLHRDLKPENVLVAADGAFKVADFGIARIQGTTMTMTGTLAGTLPYMAPERVHGHAGDARSDLFALGAILYEAVSGRRAFPGRSEPAVMQAILNEEPPPIETNSPRLAALAHLATRLLAKEPRDRPANAEAVAGMLEGLTATPAHPRRRRWLLPAAAASVALLLAAAAWMLAHRVPPTANPPAVAVLYFENMTDSRDPGRLGPITGNLLVTSLAQSPGVDVLGTERVLDVLRRLGRDGRALDRGMALEVARRAGAGRLVAGSILQVSPTLVMTAELVDAKSGRVLDAFRVEGEPGQTVFQVVDQIGRRLVSRLASPSEAERLASVSQRTSADLEAVRRYLDGLEHLTQGELKPASRAFQSAIERDSNFAQAQYQLAITRWWMGEPGNAESAVRDAARHRDRLSPMEQDLLRGVEALVEMDYQRAGRVFEAVLAQDPKDKLALYGLIEARYHGSDREGTIQAGRRLLAVDSTFTLASVHLVDAAAQTRRFALAESVAVAGLRINPRNELLWASYATSLLARGDGTATLRATNESVASGVRNVALLMAAVELAISLDSLQAERRYRDVFTAMPLPPLVHERIRDDESYLFALRAGHFREAERIATESWRAFENPNAVPNLGAPLIPLADGIEASIGTRNVERGRTWSDSIGSRVRRWIRMGEAPGHINRAVLMLRFGRRDEAEKDLAFVESLPSPGRNPDAERYLRGLLLGEDGKTDEALALLASGSRPGPPGEWNAWRLDKYRLLESRGRHAEALSQLDSLMGAPLVGMADAVRLLFYRGRTLDRLGRLDEARAAYVRFLSLWKSADPGTPEVDEARAALRRIDAPGRAASAKP